MKPSKRKQLLDAINNSRSNARGSDKYVIETLGIVAQSSFNLEETVANFKKGVESLGASAERNEKASRRWAVIAAIVSIIQLSVALSQTIPKNFPFRDQFLFFMSAFWLVISVFLLKFVIAAYNKTK